MGAFFKDLVKTLVVAAITFTAKELVESINGKGK